VRDPDVQREVLGRVVDAAPSWAAITLGVVDSGLPGPKGNREFFLHLAHRPGESTSDDADRWIADAVG
jgi:23S rRNA (cytidine1920-2'-O)/16S rRNA (cytidine1409-2'-O)-methyltransferase